jgi:hypothetical protein
MQAAREVYRKGTSTLVVNVILKCKVKRIYHCGGLDGIVGTEIEFHSFPNLAMDGGEWLTLHVNCFTPQRKKLLVPIR